MRVRACARVYIRARIEIVSRVTCHKNPGKPYFSTSFEKMGKDGVTAFDQLSFTARYRSVSSRVGNSCTFSSTRPMR